MSTHPREVRGFDVHSHKCRAAGCGTVWTHERLLDTSEAVYHKAHDCPKCGKNERNRHYGPDAAQLTPMSPPTGSRILDFFAALARDLDALERNGENWLEDLDGEEGHDVHRHV